VIRLVAGADGVEATGVGCTIGPGVRAPTGRQAEWAVPQIGHGPGSSSHISVSRN